MDQQQQALHELLARTSGYNGYRAQVCVVDVGYDDDDVVESVTTGLWPDGVEAS